MEEKGSPFIFTADFTDGDKFSTPHELRLVFDRTIPM